MNEVYPSLHDRYIIGLQAHFSNPGNKPTLQQSRMLQKLFKAEHGSLIVHAQRAHMNNKAREQNKKQPRKMSDKAVKESVKLNMTETQRLGVK